MKNLQEYVDKVWTSAERAAKITAITDMINASHAKKATKIKALRDIVHKNNEQLDKFAIDYTLSGMGMKVL